MDREEEKMTATFNRVVQSYIVASFLSIRSFSLSSSFLTGERERTGEGGGGYILLIHPTRRSISPCKQASIERIKREPITLATSRRYDTHTHTHRIRSVDCTGAMEEKEEWTGNG